MDIYRKYISGCMQWMGAGGGGGGGGGGLSFIDTVIGLDNQKQNQCKIVNIFLLIIFSICFGLQTWFM